MSDYRTIMLKIFVAESLIFTVSSSKPLILNTLLSPNTDKIPPFATQRTSHPPNVLQIQARQVLKVSQDEGQEVAYADDRNDTKIVAHCPYKTY